MSARSALAAVAVALAVGGCGNKDAAPETEKRASIAAPVRAPASTEITAADLRRVKPQTASHAFLEYWSDLQWQDWVSALGRYSPGFRRVVGTSKILEALKYQASFYRSVKPKIERESTRQALTTVRYSFDTSGTRRLSSTILRKQDGRWTLVFDVLLNGALQSWAQTRTQQLTAPGAAKPTKEALKAGIEASELQARYLPFLGLKTEPGAGSAGRSDSADGAENPG